MYKNIYDFSNLLAAYKKARPGKLDNPVSNRFEINMLECIIHLSDQLKNKTYTPGNTTKFKVYCPKERDIESNTFRDKVVQHSLCDNVLYPSIQPKFILDNYASQTGKGVSFGLKRLEKHLRHYYFSKKFNPNYTGDCTDGWVLKCDIRKFFANVRHDILKQKIREIFTDQDVIELLDMIIDSVSDPSLPIGFQSSQLLSLLLLNDFDHMIKEKLKIKGYGRYVDDFYLIHEDKEYLKYCLEVIRKYLAQYGLELNEKTQIFPLRNGIDFLGFHTYLTETGKVIRKLRKSSKDNMRRKLKRFKKMYDNGCISMYDIAQSYSSWKAHAKNGNTYHLIKEMDKLYNSLFFKQEVDTLENNFSEKQKHKGQNKTT